MAATTNKLAELIADIVSIFEGLTVNNGTSDETVFAAVYDHFITPNEFSMLSFKRADGGIEAVACILVDDGNFTGGDLRRHNSMTFSLYVMMYFRNTDAEKRWARTWNALKVAILKMNRHTEWSDPTVSVKLAGFNSQTATQGIIGDDVPLPPEMNALRLNMEVTIATGII